MASGHEVRLRGRPGVAAALAALAVLLAVLAALAVLLPLGFAFLGLLALVLFFHGPADRPLAPVMLGVVLLLVGLAPILGYLVWAAKRTGWQLAPPLGQDAGAAEGCPD